MRQIVIRTMGLVLMFVVSLPFSFAQATIAKKPTAKNKKRTERETVLKAEEGLDMKSQPPARTGRLAPAEKWIDEDDDSDAEAHEKPGIRVMNDPNEHRLVRGLTFHSD